MTNEKIEEKKIEQIEEKKIEQTEDDHITFECGLCNKVFDPGRDVIDDAGSRVEKKNFGIEKYTDAILFDLPENEKCEKEEYGKHLLIPSRVSMNIIDGTISRINKDGTEIAKIEGEDKSILTKKSQKEKEVVDLQLKIDEQMSDIAKLDENHIKIQSEITILVNDIEKQRSKFKSFTGTKNIERWMEIKKK